jgi:hypothetical protein
VSPPVTRADSFPASKSVKSIGVHSFPSPASSIISDLFDLGCVADRAATSISVSKLSEPDEDASLSFKASSDVLQSELVSDKQSEMSDSAYSELLIEDASEIATEDDSL